MYFVHISLEYNFEYNRLPILGQSYCLKITQNVAFELLNFDISTNFRSIKSDLSGNTGWPKGSGFLNLAKLAIFGIFDENFATQNENKAHFARKIECDFLGEFLGF